MTPGGNVIRLTGDDSWTAMNRDFAARDVATCVDTALAPEANTGGPDDPPPEMPRAPLIVVHRPGGTMVILACVFMMSALALGACCVKLSDDVIDLVKAVDDLTKAEAAGGE